MISKQRLVARLENAGLKLNEREIDFFYRQLIHLPQGYDLEQELQFLIDKKQKEQLNENGNGHQNNF